MDLEMIIKNRRMKGRKPHESGGLAYMLGEPTYMKMADGGDVPSPEEFLNDKHYNELRRLMDEYEQYKKNYGCSAYPYKIVEPKMKQDCNTDNCVINTVNKGGLGIY